MVKEIEKNFFDTFGIEAKCKCTKDGNCYFQECSKCDWYVHAYPQITDNILLELLVIMTRYTDIIDGFDSVQELKKFVLKELMYSLTQPECDIVKHQVRTLFEEV